MGWGKGKGKAIEHALHEAERQEERAALRALRHGDVAGALAHERNAEAIASVEHHPHWKGKGKGKHKGKGYGHAAEVVVVAEAPTPATAVVVVEATPAAAVVVEAVPVKPVVVVEARPGAKAHGKGAKGAERALHRAEIREEAMAGASLARGDVVGAAIHAEKASELKAAEKAVHREVVRAEARHAHHEEGRQEHLAARALAHGNIFGAIAHEVKACRAHGREKKLESELRATRAW